MDTNRYLKAVNIEWDVDLAEDLDSLPKEVQIPDGMTDTEESCVTVTSKEFKAPINLIKLSDVLLRRTFSLKYIFELKEYKIGVAQACCPDLFV